MTEASTRMAMARLCAPQSIAVVGASEDRAKFGGRVMHQLVRHGYAGTLYPINPRRATVNGLPAYPSVAAVPRPPDAAIIAVPAAALLGTVRDCAAGGVGVAIIITGNLAQGGDDDPARLEREVVAVARAAGMHVLGPNCLGVINAPARLAFSPSVTMAVDALPVGPVGIASQSGALMTAMFMRGYDAGIGFSSCISVGNQADLELADAFEYLVDDAATGAICLYVEGIKDLARFRAAAERARAAGKPVVAVKAGRTDAGAAMARSHTGALAGSYDGFAALAERLGVVLTDQAECAVLCAAALARHGAPRAGGLAVLSSSGGAAVLACDAVAADGKLQVAHLGAASRALLAELAPQPVDVAMLDLGGFRRPFVLADTQRTLRALAADTAVGAVVYVMTPQPLMAETGAALADLDGPGGVPVALVSTAGSVAAEVHASLRRRGVPVHPGIDDALRVLRALMRYRELRACAVPAPEDAAAPALDAAVLHRCAGALTRGPVDEHQTKQLLAAAGVPVTAGLLAQNVQAAVRHARALGYPVVLKAAAPALVHKSDVGAVRLGLTGDAAVRAAYAAIVDAVTAAVPQAELRGCLVQEMIEDGVFEAFVGARHDPQHGPLLLVGAGGVLVELRRDVAVLAAPAGPAQVLRALRRLACWPLLDGARGRPPADVHALAALASRVGRMVVTLGADLVELDLNPVLVRAAGAGAVAVDARAVWMESGHARSETS